MGFLGWCDYTGDINQITRVRWDVDTVTFWLNDPEAAFDTASGANIGACCLPDGSCVSFQPSRV